MIPIFELIVVLQAKKISKNQQVIAFPDSSNKPDWMHGSDTGFNLPLQSDTGMPAYSLIISLTALCFSLRMISQSLYIRKRNQLSSVFYNN